MIDQLAGLRLIKEKLLRIDISEVAEWEGEPLYEVILQRAAKLGIAAGTVYRGLVGYTEHRNAATMWSTDPILVAIVDREEKIEQLVEALRPMLIVGSRISISDVAVVMFAERQETKQQNIAAERPRS